MKDVAVKYPLFSQCEETPARRRGTGELTSGTFHSILHSCTVLLCECQPRSRSSEWLTLFAESGIEVFVRSAQNTVESPG
jgi:hypothetical protein